MHSRYTTREDMDAIKTAKFEAHLAANRKKQKGGTHYQIAMAQRRLKQRYARYPRWKCWYYELKLRLKGII